MMDNTGVRRLKTTDLTMDVIIYLQALDPGLTKTVLPKVRSSNFVLVFKHNLFIKLFFSL